MKNIPQNQLDLRVGKNTVEENLRRAIEMGRVVEKENGTLGLPGGLKSNLNWMFVAHGPSLHCNFLMDFMFDQAYAQSAMPLGCSSCYKVKVVLRTLRELVAGWELGKRINCRSKWGTDLNNPYSQNIYAGYFYISGLETARALYEVVRAAFDADPNLGPDASMTIKRGCSEYEAKLGPSDQYTFTPGMSELEADLLDRFSEQKSDYQPSLVLAHWIETAFRIGDDTYLDFTGGTRLRRKTVVYDPVARK
jgi:hypothetical protein